MADAGEEGGSMIGPCVKQTVTATIVTPDGRRFVGTNFVRNAQPTCPRAGMPTGVGYELCRSVCDQPAHAEVNAIAEAAEHAQGATLYLEGHTYACEPCKAAAEAAGIAEIVIGSPPRSMKLPRTREERIGVLLILIAFAVGFWAEWGVR